MNPEFDFTPIAAKILQICQDNTFYEQYGKNAIHPTDASYPLPRVDREGKLITKTSFLSKFYQHNPDYPKHQPWNIPAIVEMLKANHQRTKSFAQ